MCLGLPGCVASVDARSGRCLVEIAGVVRDVDVSLLSGPVLPGDHLLVHSGIALERMSAEQARDAGSLFAPPGPLRKDLTQDQ